MRQIGHLENEAAARTFSDLLYVQGIKNLIEPEKDQGWVIWIHAEEELERARQLLASFRTNPADPKFQTEAQAAARLREQEEKGEAAYRKKIKSRRNLFGSMTAYGFGPLTFVLIGISVYVFIRSKFGREVEPLYGLLFSKYRTGMPEIREGEIWRLVTPMFIHFHPLHIFFNMLWLRDLGSMIEGRQSTWLFAILVFVIAAVSNLAQYLTGGPIFGGMSGVVYGLFGYVWIRGKFDPGSGLFLHPSTVTMMIIWFFVCLTGILPIANTAHGVGLGIGIAWGYLSSLKRR